MDGINFLSNYQKTLFEQCNDVNKAVEIQRKCIAQMYSASCSSLDNATTCSLLERKLKDYSATVEENDVYDSRLKNILSRVRPGKTHEFRTNLDTLDIKSLVKPLSCCNNQQFTCTNSEKASESEYNDFLQAFQQTREINELKQRKISKGRASTDTKSTDRDDRFKKFDSGPPKTSAGCFKTARDELQIQNAKKYGSAQTAPPQTSAGMPKRKLGTRRNINSRFVSPLQAASNDSNEDVKSDEWAEADGPEDGLKHIDPKMVELIKSEIMHCGPSVDWNDIAGLNFAKTAIQEAVVWPMLRPDIFTGLRRPPKGILLFGPPGTGKTLIGKCVASQSKSTFFSISASSLTSKWIGDGEKMVRALFSVARVYQPAVIFIDEIDSLLSQRSDSEHESSRRIKTEFLVQLDGATTDGEERILVIGATNRPQELDEAARRRFVKRLYIPLPELDARLQLVNRLIFNERHCLNSEHFKQIAELSGGYSGADIRNLCSEASLGPIRSIDMSMIERIQATEVRPLVMEDFEKAFTRVRSSVSPQDLDHYIAWDKTYGSGCGL